MRKHIDYVLHLCNQRTYLLTQLKRQGLPLAQLQSVFDAIILSRVLYAAPAWRGYLSAADTECLQQLFIKAERWNIVSNVYNIEAIFDNCDQTLFRSSLNSNHCLHHLYPDKRENTHNMTLRLRGHNFSLPRFKYQQAMNSFVNRSLYKYLYLYCY